MSACSRTTVRFGSPVSGSDRACTTSAAWARAFDLTEYTTRVVTALARMKAETARTITSAVSSGAETVRAIIGITNANVVTIKRPNGTISTGSGFAAMTLGIVGCRIAPVARKYATT